MSIDFSGNVRVLDRKHLPAPLQTCEELGAGAEGIAYRCGEFVLKWYHCVGEVHPFNSPLKSLNLWNSYYSKTAPDYPKATLTTAKALFPEHDWTACNHEVLVTPFIRKLRALTRRERLDLEEKYVNGFGRTVMDLHRGNAIMDAKERPLILDFGFSFALRSLFREGTKEPSELRDLQGRSFPFDLSKIMVTVLDPENLPKPLEPCETKGRDDERSVFRCGGKDYAFYHCVNESSPFHSPEKVKELWESYYSKMAPEYAKASLTDANKLFPEHDWTACNHPVLITPAILGRELTNQEVAAVQDEYRAKFQRIFFPRVLSSRDGVTREDGRFFITNFGSSVELRQYPPL